MKLLSLSPEQIIALNDEHLFSQEALKKYFEIFKNKVRPLPVCPVIRKSAGIPYFTGKDKKAASYNNKFKEFIESHPKAEYFLLDGNHKTTAATLTHQKIPVIVIENDSDFTKIDESKKSGWYKIGNSMSEAIKLHSESLFEYYSKDFGFSTVEEKTKKLIKSGQIPEYMAK